MKALCAKYLKLGADKHGQLADYSEVPLPNELVLYACLDAWLSLALYTVLEPLAAQAQQRNTFTGTQDSPGLLAGATAIHEYRGQALAQVEDLFIGGSGGEQQKWGNLRIGKGKSLVRLLKDVFYGFGETAIFIHSECRGVEKWDPRLEQR
jgi:hypothetical protein